MGEAAACRAAPEKAPEKAPWLSRRFHDEGAPFLVGYRMPVTLNGELLEPDPIAKAVFEQLKKRFPEPVAGSIMMAAAISRLYEISRPSFMAGAVEAFDAWRRDSDPPPS